MHIHSTTTIDANDPAFAAQLLQHPLMQAERHRERADLHHLAATSWSDVEAQRPRDA